MKNAKIIFSVVVAAVIVSITILLFLGFGSKGTARIQVVEVNNVPGSGHFTLSGRVVNSGNAASNPVILKITITDMRNNTLYTDTTSPEPSIVQPKQESTFNRIIPYAALGNYSGEWRPWVAISGQ